MRAVAQLWEGRTAFLYTFSLCQAEFFSGPEFEAEQLNHWEGEEVRAYWVKVRVMMGGAAESLGGRGGLRVLGQSGWLRLPGSATGH